MKKIALTCMAALALVFAGACADNNDDTDADLSAEASGSVDAYCDLAGELDALEEMPSDEQLDEIIEVAPDEIKQDVRTVVEAVRTENFEDPDAQAAGERLEDWEADNCDAGADDSGDDTDGDTDTDTGPGSETDDTDTTDTNTTGDDGETTTSTTDGSEVEAEVNTGSGY